MDISMYTFDIVTRGEQLRQSIELLLKNRIGSWCQSYDVGSYVDLHSSREPALRQEVIETISQLSYIDIKSVDVVGDVVNVSVAFNGDDINLSIPIEQ